MARTIAKDHSDKRQAILHSSAELFASQGYGRATMSQIADACGVSKANIYHYYDGKEALLFDILDSHLSELRDRICGIVFTSHDPRDQLQEVITEILLSYQGSDAAHKVQINAISVLTGEKREILRQYQRDLVNFVQSHILRVANHAQKTPAELRDITMSLFAMTNWHFQWDGRADDRRRRDYARVICDLICGGSN